MISLQGMEENGLVQILTNRGPDSRFVLKAIIRAQISKSSRSSIMKHCLVKAVTFLPINNTLVRYHVAGCSAPDNPFIVQVISLAGIREHL